MKKLLPVVLLSALAVGCSRVDVGYEGIIVNKLGDDKGMEQQAKGVGRYWLSWNEELYTYPVFTQTKIWTDDERDGSMQSEEFSITTKDGGSFKVDIGINYRVGKDQSPLVFQKWRTNINNVTNNHMRRLVQDKFTQVGSTYTAFEVMAKRSEIVNKVEKELIDGMSQYGIVIENVFMIGISAPPSIMRAMEEKMKAVERTAQRVQEIEQAKAEAEKRIAEAQGKARAIHIEGEALKTNPLVLEARKVEKWNGELPKVTGSSDVMVDVGGFVNGK